jgi:homoserine kinase
LTSFATASAPASIGNIGVGFDVLGQAFDVVRDTVRARRVREPGASLGKVTGIVDRLPAETGANTALAAAAALLEAAKPGFGVRLDIDKQIPISAGMGGSAASAVAAAAAVNTLLETPFEIPDLFPFALAGETASADPPPWDNVMAALHGGLVMAARLDPPLIVPLPAPDGVTAILFHPDARTDTAAARQLLAPSVPMHTAVEHARRISAFVLGCTRGDPALIRAGLDDILVEPQRATLLLELASVKAAAREAGALGCSFSGSGPSVFAWADDALAGRVEAAMADAFANAGRAAQAYTAPLTGAGVRVQAASSG